MSSTRRWFGTDGMRGRFGDAPLDERTVRAFGHVLARQLAQTAPGRPVVLGGDTRASTPTLGRWLSAGLHRAGIPILFLGTVPTPAIASVARDARAALGIAISASHNPAEDNGIKLIGGDGFKWPSEHESKLERALREHLDGAPASAGAIDPDPPSPPVDQAALDRYLASLRPRGEHDSLRGLRVALDTANGAASPFAEALFRAHGATVTVLHDTPDGNNINRDCGSTHPGALAARVAQGRYDLGFAFDGDADRAIMVDENGVVRDGDAMLYLWARALDSHQALPARAIVATSMSNLGLEVALRHDGIGVVRCDVGDRVVVETLRRDGLRLGGEQSGHIVDLELSTTGDGLRTAIELTRLRAAADAPLSAMLAGFTTFPQLLRNVPVARKTPFTELPGVQAAAREVEQRLGESGRLVLRYSGTEPLARIMIEGPDQAVIESMADEIERAIETVLT